MPSVVGIASRHVIPFQSYAILTHPRYGRLEQAVARTRVPRFPLPGARHRDDTSAWPAVERTLVLGNDIRSILPATVGIIIRHLSAAIGLPGCPSLCPQLVELCLKPSWAFERPHCLLLHYVPPPVVVVVAVVPQGPAPPSLVA